MTTKTPISMGPRTFRVLTIEQLAEVDKAAVRVQFAKFTSAWDAFQSHQDKGFAKVSISPSGRVYSLQYRGIEVALLVKRHAYTIELNSMETAPALVLKSEDDDWVMVDLLNVSDSLTEHSFTKSLSSAQSEVKQLRATLTQRESILEMKGALINDLENKLQDYKDREAKRAKRAAAAKFAASAPPTTPVKPKSKPKSATKPAATVAKSKPKPKPKPARSKRA